MKYLGEFGLFFVCTVINAMVTAQDNITSLILTSMNAFSLIVLVLNNGDLNLKTKCLNNCWHYSFAWAHKAREWHANKKVSL